MGATDVCCVRERERERVCVSDVCTCVSLLAEEPQSQGSKLSLGEEFLVDDGVLQSG